MTMPMKAIMPIVRCRNRPPNDSLSTPSEDGLASAPRISAEACAPLVGQTKTLSTRGSAWPPTAIVRAPGAALLMSASTMRVPRVADGALEALARVAAAAQRGHAHGLVEERDREVGRVLRVRRLSAGD